MQPDELPDTLWYLGDSEAGIESDDGMVVFGFGRSKGTKPMLRDAGQQFRIAFVDLPVGTKPGDPTIQDLMAMTASQWFTPAADNPAAEVIEKPLDAAEEVDAQAPPTAWRGPQPAKGRPWPSHAHWSRANRKRECEFAMPVKPEQIERAELHMVVWDGGAGTITDYFRFNGNSLAVAAGGAHDVIHSKLPLEPSWIVPEGNRAELLSDTDHHGIEVLYPGPMMAIRYRLQQRDANGFL